MGDIVATRVCVFAKPPVAGEVKTRLVPTVGPAVAAALARAFLLDTLAAVRSIPWADPVVATTGDMAPHLPHGETLPCWPQGEGDLGRRMERILRRALVDRPAAIAVGADSPGLPRRLMEQATAALEDHDAVLGPADDGGFYLVGLGRCPEGLFEGLPWSRADTLSSTHERFVEQGLSVVTIDPWFDVDHHEDLELLARMIRDGSVQAEETRKVVERLEL